MSVKELIANLTHKEIDILLAFQENPLATFDQIAQMTKLPKTTVFDIIKRLDGLFFVNAVPNLQTLGLELVDVIVEADSGQKIRILEKLAYSHPYISYFSRSFGTFSGMYFRND